MRAQLSHVGALAAGSGRRDGRLSLCVGTTKAVVAALAGAMLLMATTPAAAATPGVTLRMTSLSPLVAVIAGILILVMPSLLNYIVALYLILVGLLGFFGR